ncbi:MAG TPA: extracellular solute-binding protein [Acidisoma sp.]|uniref:extracellular solute-binding protein n=1 Tax=Acidisoma sp. TaxID=1872115 RepID=UPI002D091D17|nr:extracellular solute-binding protein [Acidisoma sp.]HTI01267.1 extracellular solute-binding protein [Acidisoma sp.]
MKRAGLCLAAVFAALFGITAAASAAEKTHVVWWDFLSGGDGVRMKALIAQFNAEHPNIEIDGTTLQWGTPFYTKVQTSAAVGQGPDIMTYHLSRLPLGVSTGTLRPYTDAELASVGLSAKDFFPSDWSAAHVDGKLYAIPLDIHSIILYYNKDLLAKEGLLGPDGLPKGLDGIANFDAALKKLTGKNGAEYGVSFASSDDDGATDWRIFYTLLNQMGGTFLQDDRVLPGDSEAKAVKATETIADWVKQGWAPKLTDYPASIALFTSGKAAMHINGVWEVPTMIDLAKSGKLGFHWGAVQIPVLFDHAATWADSHSFAIPNRRGNPVPPEKIKADLTVIAWIEHHAILWAGAGHIPAYRPVTDSPAFQKMQPNATYASLAKTAVFDPRSKIAGVASPIYDACNNFIQPAINGQIAASAAIAQLKDELEGDLQ